MADVVRRIGLSLGADVCWPICYEELLHRLDLGLHLDGDVVRFEVERVTIEPFDLRARPFTQLPPEAQEMFGRYSGRGVVERAVTFVFGLIVFAIAGSIFGTLGGVLGAAMFRKDPPPATPPMPPTPTETPLVP